MKNLKLLLASFALLFGFLAFAPVGQASAVWNPFGDVCRNGGGESAVCQDRDERGDPVTGNNGIILKVVNIIAFVAGAAAVIIIILAGLRFITAAGGSEDIAGARRTLIYAAVGLIIIVLARTLVAFIIGKV